MCDIKDRLITKYKEIEKSKAKILEKLKKYLDDIKVEDWTNRESNVCFVLSCPGERELVKGKVCAGQTGENLGYILSYLHGKKEEIFPSKNRYDYIIINASDKVHFHELTGNSEASREEIKDKKNIQRIKDIFNAKQIEYVILFGKKAQSIRTIIEENDKKMIFVDSIHLSNQSINSYDYTEEEKGMINQLDNSEKRKKRRLELIADIILKALSER